MDADSSFAKMTNAVGFIHCYALSPPLKKMSRGRDLKITDLNPKLS